MTPRRQAPTRAAAGPDMTTKTQPLAGKRRPPARAAGGPDMTTKTRPLAGKRILVTRPRAQAAELAERLAALGAEAISAPAIRIAPPDDARPLDEACAAAASFAWIVFTSANAVDAFLGRPGGGAAAALAGVRICAVGPATGARIARHGLAVDLQPADHRGEGVAAALRAGRDLRGARILLPRADLARPALPDALRAAGADVVEVTAYRTIGVPGWPGRAVREMLRRRKLDAVTFTSASAVRSAVEALGAARAVELLRPAVVAAIGPVTAQAARRLGVETEVMPSTYTTEALAAALADHFRVRGAGPVSSASENRTMTTTDPRRSPERPRRTPPAPGARP